MANIAEYLNAIQSAVYGEEVRSSIYNAIDLINKVGEVNITLGTAVTSTSSSIAGYYSKSVYINTNTWDLWVCTGSAWEKKGNLLGSSINRFTKTGTKANTNDLVDIYHIYTDNGADIGLFEVTNGEKVTSSKSYNNATITLIKSDGTTSRVTISDGTKITSGTAVTATNSSVSGQYLNDLYLNISTWDIWKCTTSSNGSGTSWTKLGNIKGGQGIQGIRGYDFTGLVLKSTTNLTKTYNVMSSDGTVTGTIDITDGKSADSVSKTNTVGLVDTYTMYDDLNNVIGTFTITNGKSVSSISKTSTSGLSDTYTMYDEESKAIGTFTLVNGKSVSSTSKTGTSGLNDTYTMYDEENHAIGTFTITNGRSASSISKTGQDGLVDTYTIYDQLNASIGTFSVINGKSADHTSKTGTSGLTDTYTIYDDLNNAIGTFTVTNGEKGDTGISINNIALVTKNGRTSTYRVNLDNGTSAGTFEVLDGETGPQGFSPTISSSKTGIITTVTVTDVNGEHVFQIRDGDSGDGSGDMLKSVYDDDNDGVIGINNLPVATIEELRAAIDAVRQ